ncbi:hypothetical protein FH972_023505 [Carpinus fangiana]|uniref:C2H2-type domain-containing protein n=1 Tax=Carpinus fangiana TaxID=176857 RepID=A0A5N6KVV2_9ROSI|nr:hypothetical protein FH972_023505 [Carpinus fangiana]
MADKKGAYGTGTSDTGFRKTWDREEFAAKAKDRDNKTREEGKARYEAVAAGKKYVRRASTPPDARETESRSKRLDVSSMVGKQTLVPASAGVGKRGRGAGFYCEDCDLTFKDNLQLVEHLNSRQHLVAIGQTGEVKRATLDDVKARLAWLVRKKKEEKDMESIDLGKRIEMQREQDAMEREEKRRKRNEKRRKTKDGVGDQVHDDGDDGVIR